MSNHSDLHEALDRLAGAADADFAENPMPGIRAEARRNRNRVAVLSGVGLAAAVVVGYAALSAGPDATRTDDSGIAETMSVSLSPTPTEITPEPVPIDTARADVNGDGTPDRVRLMGPAGTTRDEPATETWLEVRTATTTFHTFTATDYPTYVSFLDPGPVDLDGNGGAEVLVFETGGGESGGLSVWTWVGGTLERATPAEGTPSVLANEAGLASGGEELGVAYQDGALLTWRVVTLGSQEVTVWQWAIDGTTLSATKLPGTQCISFGVLSPC